MNKNGWILGGHAICRRYRYSWWRKRKGEENSTVWAQRREPLSIAWSEFGIFRKQTKTNPLNLSFWIHEFPCKLFPPSNHPVVCPFVWKVSVNINSCAHIPIYKHCNPCSEHSNSHPSSYNIWKSDSASEHYCQTDIHYWFWITGTSECCRQCKW